MSMADLSNQGAQSSRSNVQYWLDWGSSEEGKATLAREKAGTLAKNEESVVAAYHHFQDKGQKEGIQPSKTVSESTGVPDLTDRAVQSRKMAQSLSLMSGRGRKQSFLGGDYNLGSLGGGSILGES